jgi:uracil-DNA glycosylase
MDVSPKEMTFFHYIAALHVLSVEEPERAQEQAKWEARRTPVAIRETLNKTTACYCPGCGRLYSEERRICRSYLHAKFASMQILHRLSQEAFYTLLEKMEQFRLQYEAEVHGQRGSTLTIPTIEQCQQTIRLFIHLSPVRARTLFGDQHA